MRRGRRVGAVAGFLAASWIAVALASAVLEARRLEVEGCVRAGAQADCERPGVVLLAGRLLVDGLTGLSGRDADTNQLVWRATAFSASLTGALVAGSLAMVVLVGLGLPLAHEMLGRPTATRVLIEMASTLSAVPSLIWCLLFVVAGLPLFGFVPEFATFRDDPSVVHRALASVLPMIAIAGGDQLLASVLRKVDSEINRIRAQEYWVTVRLLRFRRLRTLALGLTPALGNLIASNAAMLVSSAIVAELVFNWLGLGRRILDGLRAAAGPNMPMLLASTGVLVLVVVAIRALRDAALRRADRRFA